jgi:hypothetical protein
MPPPRDRGFFDKVNNAFFVIVDSVFDFLEKRGWNVPIETRFLFHAFLFIALFYLASSILIEYFYFVEALIFVLMLLTFSAANVRPIRQLLGYYTSDEKIHSIVNKINNNQISIREVIEHLNKNLLPPHLTLSIIHAYQRKERSLPPPLVKSVLRQPRSVEIVEEVIKGDLTDSDFSVLMRNYKNLLNRDTLLKVLKSQRMSKSKLRDALFFQESAYTAIDAIASLQNCRDLIGIIATEKRAYQKKPLLKNYLRNHERFLSVALSWAVAMGLTIPLYYAVGLLAIAAGVPVLAILYGFFHFYFLEWIYFRV